MKKTFFHLLIILLLFQSCYREEISYNTLVDKNYELPLMLNFDHKACSYDQDKNTLRYSQDIKPKEDYYAFVEFQEFSSVTFNGMELLNKQVNNLGEIEYNKNYEVVITARDQRKTLNLMFTNLPIIQIITPNSIFNEPKIPAIMIINHLERQEYLIGIEYRGQSSLGLPKKSMGFSLRNPINYNQNISSSLFGFKANNDWILDAMYRDNSKVRASTSFSIWEDITNNSKTTIHSKHIELFINNKHMGLYCLREKYNAELFEILNSNSVVYKSIDGQNGATRFETYSNKPPITSVWDGWEQVHPDPEKKLFWDPLQDLRYLTAASDSAYFCSNISSIINLAEYIDLCIFLHVSYAKDCISKNMFLLKEQEEKFVFIPWDLDPTWGLFWNGAHISHWHIPSEHLFERLLELNPHNFKERLKSRWFELRADILSEDRIITRFNDNIDLISKSNIISIEDQTWDMDIDLEGERNFIHMWIGNRLDYLDIYFNNI